MSYVLNHVIIVSSFSSVGAEMMKEAHEKATEIFGIVSNILLHKYNGGQTFLVGPNGSKQGWGPDEEGDRHRTKFIEWLETKKFSDGSCFIHWVEVSCGDFVGSPVIGRTSHIDPRYRT